LFIVFQKHAAAAMQNRAGEISLVEQELEELKGVSTKQM